MMRRGRPGLIGTVARTAVVAGTATAVSNNVSRRQYERQAAKEQPQYQEAPAPSGGGGMSEDTIQKLKQLGELQAQGILTPEEFAQQKAALLNG